MAHLKVRPTKTRWSPQDLQPASFRRSAGGCLSCPPNPLSNFQQTRWLAHTSNAEPATIKQRAPEQPTREAKVKTLPKALSFSLSTFRPSKLKTDNDINIERTKVGLIQKREQIRSSRREYQASCVLSSGTLEPQRSDMFVLNKRILFCSKQPCSVNRAGTLPWVAWKTPP